MSVKATARAPIVPISPTSPDDTDDDDAIDAALYPKPENEPLECNECDADYVMHGGDKVCPSCGLLSGVGDVEIDDSDPWEEWHEHRRNDDEIGGYYGEDRVKMIGGFSGPWFWDDEDDEYLSG